MQVTEHDPKTGRTDLPLAAERKPRGSNGGGVDTRLGTKSRTRPATEAERPTRGAEPSGPAAHAERSRPSARAQALGAGVSEPLQRLVFSGA